MHLIQPCELVVVAGHLGVEGKYLQPKACIGHTYTHAAKTPVSSGCPRTIFSDMKIRRFILVAAVYQGHRLGLDELLSPLENLAWFAGLQDQRLDRDHALAALARLGLLAEAHTACYRLSAGQQRRAAIARWLLAEHPLWLLDEPFNALDVQSRVLLNEILYEHCQGGGAVVCATHLQLQVDGKVTLELEPVAEVLV